MKFLIDIDFDEYADEYGFDNEQFITSIKECIADKVAENYIINVFGKKDWTGEYAEVGERATEIIKKEQSQIIQQVIDKVSDRIEKKKELMEITPKAKDVSNINKENKEYFMKLIDECIAKKFKNII